MVPNRLVDGVDLHSCRTSGFELRWVSADVPVDVALDLEGSPGRWGHCMVMRSLEIAPSYSGSRGLDAYDRRFHMDGMGAVIGVTMPLIPMSDWIAHKKIAFLLLLVEQVYPVGDVAVDMGKFDVAVSSSVLFRNGMWPCEPVLRSLSRARKGRDNSQERQNSKNFS
jgi:hypothetical protein